MAQITPATTPTPPSLLPTQSPLTTFITTNLPSTPTPRSPHHHALALQVQHNLQHQHDWTSLHIHTTSPLPSSSLSPSPLPRPLLSGLPPQRIYIHPDEQVEMLKLGVKEKDTPGEREWVLPTHLREKWTLRGLAGVFDAVEEVPPSEGERGGVEEDGQREDKIGIRRGRRRGGKRVLLAVVGDDSTVVYYIIHDGIVKPRQN